MSTLTKPYTFTGGTYAVAAQVNADFDAIMGWINGGQAMWADGSVAFTNVPSGPSTDPSTANHLARKAYVDAGDTFGVNAYDHAVYVVGQGGVAGGPRIDSLAVVVTVDVNGNFTHPFFAAFPTALFGCVIVPGATNAGANWTVQTNFSACTLSTMAGRIIMPATNNYSGANGGTWEVCYFAYGA